MTGWRQVAVSEPDDATDSELPAGGAAQALAQLASAVWPRRGQRSCSTGGGGAAPRRHIVFLSAGAVLLAGTAAAVLGVHAVSVSLGPRRSAALAGARPESKEEEYSLASPASPAGRVGDGGGEGGAAGPQAYREADRPAFATIAPSLGEQPQGARARPESKEEYPLASPASPAGRVGDGGGEGGAAGPQAYREADRPAFATIAPSSGEQPQGARTRAGSKEEYPLASPASPAGRVGDGGGEGGAAGPQAYREADRPAFATIAPSSGEQPQGTRARLESREEYSLASPPSPAGGIGNRGGEGDAAGPQAYSQVGRPAYATIAPSSGEQPRGTHRWPQSAAEGGSSPSSPPSGPSTSWPGLGQPLAAETAATQNAAILAGGLATQQQETQQPLRGEHAKAFADDSSGGTVHVDASGTGVSQGSSPEVRAGASAASSDLGGSAGALRGTTRQQGGAPSSSQGEMAYGGGGAATGAGAWSRQAAGEDHVGGGGGGSTSSGGGGGGGGVGLTGPPQQGYGREPTTPQLLQQVSGVYPTTTKAPLTCGLISEGVNFPGNDLSHVSNISSPGLCCQVCAAVPACVAWTWGRQRGESFTDTCYLKSGKPKASLTVVEDKMFVSGQPTQVGRSISVSKPWPGLSLFCFSLMLPWGYEKSLLRLQYDRGSGIFACNEYAIYSNQKLQPAPGVQTYVVDSTLKCELGGEFMTALNTPIFMKLWAQIVSDGRFRFHDWTVKADPDSVFFPSRLRAMLPRHKPGERGVYLNNCRHGLHGPLEVFSTKAVITWASGAQRCTEHFNKLCSGPCAWGEDLFIDQCLWKVLKVKREDEPFMLLEDHCDPPSGWDDCKNTSFAAYHPFKTVEGYRKCMDGALGVPAGIISGLTSSEGSSSSPHQALVSVAK